MNGWTRTWATLHAMVVAGFLIGVASYYHPGTGFTPLVPFPRGSHDTHELPRVREAAHHDEDGAAYDGQFYAQLAVDPLVRDPAIDRAMDNAPYRARRILFSWTAYLLGAGQPAWILQAYALQNVAAWLALAWLLLRWFPIGTARSFALWCGCLLTHGLLISVRYSLLDGPSALVLALAVATAEQPAAPEPWRRRGRLWATALLLGLGGLARETNLLAAPLLARWLRRTPRSWLIVAGAGVVCLIPLLLWIDYLRSVYLTSTFTGRDQLSLPFEAFRWKWRLTVNTLRYGGWTQEHATNLLALVAFATQGIFVLWAALTKAGRSSPWLPVAVGFFALGLIVDRVVWEGSPGAITRVALPLTIGFNVLARRAPWPVVIAGNATVLPGVVAFATLR